MMRVSHSSLVLAEGQAETSKDCKKKTDLRFCKVEQEARKIRLKKSRLGALVEVFFWWESQRTPLGVGKIRLEN
jgi:hypothetical protein